jgi:hypothetical protein
MDETEKEGDVARIRAGLGSLEAERIKLENELSELQRRPAQFASFDNLSAGRRALKRSSTPNMLVSFIVGFATAKYALLTIGAPQPVSLPSMNDSERTHQEYGKPGWSEVYEFSH